MLLLAKLPQYPISQLEIAAIFLAAKWGLAARIAEW
jgi:hypothetical protein